MSTYIKRQKLIKVGNSYAVTLDKDFLNQSGISTVGEITAAYTPDKGIVSLAQSPTALKSESSRNQSEKKAVVHSKISPELKEWTDKFLDENEEALKRLADL